MSVIPSFSDILSQSAPVDGGCSVYCLSIGTVVFEWLNGSISQNYSNSILPAYYITNCLVDALEDFLTLSNFTELTAPQSKLQLARNSGDSFVALLFIVSGECVLAWMLTLLLVLSPKYKQKPFLTQLSTVFYAIVSTILLSQVTRGASVQYYEDTLDLLGIHSNVYEPSSYRATIVFSQFFNSLSFLQIIYHITKHRYRMISVGVAIFLIAVFVVCLSIFEAKYDSSFAPEATNPYMIWDLIVRILKIIFITQVAGTLFYYTIAVKNPSRISYNKRVAGIGILTWVLFTLHLTIDILLITYFRVQNLDKFWVTFIPHIIEIFLLTTVWEWIFSMSTLEKREEMSGVLGRRMSLEDDLASVKNGNVKDARSRLQRFKRNMVRKEVEEEVPESPIKIFTSSSDSDYSTGTGTNPDISSRQDTTGDLNTIEIPVARTDATLYDRRSSDLGVAYEHSSSASEAHLSYHFDDSDERESAN